MTSVQVLAVAVFAAGLTLSPMIISAFGLIEALVPASVLTEGFTWATSGINIGIAIGSLLSGPVIDAHGARSAFIVTASSGLASLVVVLAGRRWLRAPAPAADAVIGEPI